MKLTRKLIAINLALLLSFSLLPIQVLAAAIDLSLTPSVSFEEPNADGYTFTPTSTGFYTVTVSSTKHEGSSSITPASCGSLEVYQGTATDVAGFTHDGLNRSIYSYTIPMEANTTYTIIPHQGEGEHTSMSVVKADISALTVGTAARFSVSNAAASELDNYHWYAPRYYMFTPSQSGWYTFDLNSSGQTGYVGSISIYDNTFKRIEYNSAYVGNGVNVYLQGGQTYYLGFEPDEAGTYSIMASPSSFPVVTTTNSQSVVTDGPTVYATFTPETSGAYLISATSTDNWLYGLDVYSRTMEWLGGARRQDDSPILSVTVNMTGESTYYIGVDGSSTISAELAGSDLSGYCGKITSQYPQGENLTWKLSSDGTLTISGTGEMADWYYYVGPDGDGCNSPWYEDTRIKRVVVEDGATSVGEFAFYRCSSLTSITIPNSVTSIGWSASLSCTNLTDVYYSGTKAQWGAVTIEEDNDPLLAATIHCTDGDINPKEDGVIASGYCGKITDRYPQGENLTWKLTTDGTLTISGTGEMADWGFRESPWYEDGRIKRIVIENGVTSLGNWAFCACSHMTSVTIPDSVTSIGWAAFYECTSLTSVEIPGSVTSIGDEAFLECTSLTSITIPDSVTSIGTYAFYACSSLTRITIPDGVTSIL